MRQKILIVDDSHVNIRINALLLESVDADIIQCTSGEAAIEKTMSEDFDLILMDVNMPGINGFEAVKIIRNAERNQYIPVIFITAFSTDELQIAEGLSLGAIDFITKPFSKVILARKVANLLELQRNRKELEHTKNVLAVNEKKFREYFHYSAIGMAIVGLEGRWVQVNKSLCDIVGYTKEELLKKTFQEITHPDDLETDLSKLKELLAGDIPYYHLEKR